MFSLPTLLRWLWVLSMFPVSGLGDTYPPPAHLTADEDHQRTLELLQIAELRQGPDGDPKSRNAANFDESKVSAKLILTTPAKATGPVPVIMQLGLSPEAWQAILKRIP